MCGIAGFLQSHPLGREAEPVLRAMTDRLHHRGPDDSGLWMDAQAGIALGHRRLSILDLSPAGHQPMASADGRYVIVFNGEIYNFEALRTELECSPPPGPFPQGERGARGARGEGALRWRGHSDTEVMLAAISRWGLEAAVRRFNGMFAFALWDRETRTLSLGRDRLGEKPLYYGWSGQAFLFASELKAIRAYPAFKEEVDRDVLALFLRYGYIPSPHCIFRGLRKLPPGTLLTVRADDAGREPEPVPYWSLRDAVERGMADPFAGTEADAVAQLDGLLREAVRMRMVADVPLGAFLSGGIDSSTVVALMQAQSGRPVKTFSIGFHEDGYNEATFAGAVARYLGTDHTELYVTPAEARAVIPRLPTLYDEPFADSSQIPTFLVSELARRQVTVSLSGDGGDELFGGYNRYFLGQRLWKRIGWVPTPARRGLGRALRAFSPRVWNTLFRRAAPFLPSHLQVQLPGDKLQKLADLMAMDDPRTLYWGLVSLWKHPAEVVLGAAEPVTVFNEARHRTSLTDFRQQMMFMDALTYLPDDILVKVDRASMGVSLEARVPMLDHRVVEFAWRLPVSMKIRHGQGKWILRQVLARYVPPALTERPKMGFGVPIDSWLRGPLRDWCDSLLDERRLMIGGFFDPRPIREKWSEHLSGHRNWQYLLWCVLMFEAWRDEQKRSPAMVAW